MRRAAVVMLAVVCLPLLLATSGRHANAATVPEALLVGDSVMAGMAQPYGAPARAQLAARHSYILDAKGCRRLITTSCSIGGNPAPTNAITAIRAMAGRYRSALVVAVGYNDPTTGPVGLETAIDVILAEARRQRIPTVVWLTYRVAGDSASRSRAHNAVLAARAAREPMLVLADWAGRSAGLPSSWFSADGIHLGADAAIAMADLIGDTLDIVDVIRPGGCVVTATTVAVAAPTAPPAAGSLGGGAGAATPARRLNVRCP